MEIMEYEGIVPTIGENCYIAQGAIVIGKVTLEDEASIWFNSIIRGDVASIFVGEGTNIQDLSTVHVTESTPVHIGKYVSIGHNVVIHGATIGDSCLIGMGSIILDGVEVGENCLVAAGSLLPPGKKYPAGCLIKGSPAIVERELNDKEKQVVAGHYRSYLGYKNKYLQMKGS